jgi:hypothetical protein
MWVCVWFTEYRLLVSLHAVRAQLQVQLQAPLQVQLQAQLQVRAQLQAQPRYGPWFLIKLSLSLSLSLFVPVARRTRAVAKTLKTKTRKTPGDQTPSDVVSDAVSKETYYSVKRDLLQCQKRPTPMSKET